jgi:hypothetical protein
MYYLQIIDICIKSHFSYDTIIEKWCDLSSCMCKKFTLYCKEINSIKKISNKIINKMTGESAL